MRGTIRSLLTTTALLPWQHLRLLWKTGGLLLVLTVVKSCRQQLMMWVVDLGGRTLLRARPTVLLGATFCMCLMVGSMHATALLRLTA